MPRLFIFVFNFIFFLSPLAAQVVSSIFHLPKGEREYHYRVAFDKNNTLWTGTSKGELFFQEGKTWKSYLLKDVNLGDIREIYFDENNYMWIGSYEYGIFNKDQNNVWKNYSKLKTGAKDDWVRLIKTRKNEVFVCTRTEFLYYNGKTWQVFNENSTPSIGNVNDMEFDIEGNLWLAAQNGIFFIDANGGLIRIDDKLKLNSSPYYGITFDKNNNLYLSTASFSNFLNVFDYNKTNKTHTFKNSYLGYGPATNLIALDNGQVWCTQYGNGVGFTDGKQVVFNFNNNTMHLKPTDLKLDPREPGILWNAGESGGLFEINFKKSTATIEREINQSFKIIAQNSSEIFISGNSNVQNVEFFDIQGKSISMKKYTQIIDNHALIEMFNIESGIYFIKINSETHSQVIRFFHSH